MEVFFLASHCPIAKKYIINERGTLKKEAYPFVSQFTSFSYDINTLEEFLVCIKEFAAAGHCLIKGVLQHPLQNESRAGSTSPESLTEWICLDFDGITAFQTVDEALEAMGLGDTSYILQWSASHLVPGEKPGLNCHIFMMLDEPQHPSILKRWLKHLNLTTEIKNQLTLAKSNNSLLWPLDITTCQNDKLIYVSPPEFRGLEDPVGPEHRISLHKRSFDTAAIPASDIPPANTVAAEEYKSLNAARKAAGFKSRKSFNFKSELERTYLVNPEHAQVTGLKTERGFTYLNLNGGDSWGYYHPVDNPTFIFNFKGEPIYRTKDLVPAYWDEIRTRVQNHDPDASGRVYLAFRDFETATYYNGVYDASSRTLLRLAQAKSESQLRHFMKQHGQPLGDYIPDWDMEFNPHAKYVVDKKNKKLNIFRPSEFFAVPPAKQDTVPPTIKKVIYHALGSDDVVYEHFLNWLAVIVQKLGMTQTAWVIHGTQGTGKGVMFNHILTPLFGPQNVTSRRMEELGSDFTEFMKNKFIVFIDEVNSGNSLFHDRITAKLKNLIVEPRISVREMYKPSVVMKNYCNLIFASNSPRPVSIAPDDRRFNVGAYQEDPISLTSDEIHILDLELRDFYNYLMTRPADMDIARSPLYTEDRKRIIDLSRPSIDIAIEALKEGNFTFFEEMLMEKTEILSPRIQVAYDQYAALIAELKDTMRTKLTRDELIIILRWCVDKVPEAPNKFTTMLRHHGLKLHPVWVGKTSVRGYDVNKWHSNRESPGDPEADE